MKLMLAILFVTSSAMAAPGDVLLTCTKTTFSDLNEIVITESDRAGEVVVTETADNGAVNMFVRSSSDLLEAKKIELSSWYGYTRNLYNDGSDWNLEYYDECSGAGSYVVCK